MSEALDGFGEVVVAARDSAFSQVERMLDGTSKAPARRDLSSKLAGLGGDNQDLVRQVVRESVDAALHDLLFALYSNDRVSLAFDRVDLRSTSDGLHGDYVTEKGWGASANIRSPKRNRRPHYCDRRSFHSNSARLVQRFRAELVFAVVRFIEKQIDRRVFDGIAAVVRDQVLFADIGDVVAIRILCEEVIERLLAIRAHGLGNCLHPFLGVRELRVDVEYDAAERKQLVLHNLAYGEFGFLHFLLLFLLLSSR